MGRNVMGGLRKYFAIVLLALACAVPGPAPRAAEGDLGQGALIRILKGEGYGSVKPRGKDAVSFTVEGQAVALFVLAEGDLQLYFATRGTVVGLDAINEWNREYRFARAYIDDDGDPVLKADLLAHKDLSAAAVASFVRVFAGLVSTFREEVLSGGQ